MSRQDLSTQANEAFNPYTAPRTSIKPLPTLGGEVAIPFSLDSVMSRTWAIFASRPMLCIGIYAVGVFLNLGSQIGISAASVALLEKVPDPAVGQAFNLIGSLVVMIFGIWLTVGQTLALLNLTKGRPASLGNLFAGAPFLLTMIVASIAVTLLGMAVMALGLIPGFVAMAALGMGTVEPTTVLLFGLGLIAAVLFASIYWVYLSQYFFVVVDRPTLGAIGSLRESVRITKGKFWSISLIYLVAFVVNVLGMLALVIGLVFTIPFTFLMLAVMYTALASERPLAKDPRGESAFD